MSAFLDVVRFMPTTGGMTDWTVASAVIGYRTPTSAGAINGTVYSYRAESGDLTQWEIGFGAYTSSGAVLARTTVTANSLGTTAKINFTTVPQVAIVALSNDLWTAADLDAAYVNVAGDTMTGAMSCNSTITAGYGGTTGYYYFGNSGTKYLNYDGANFNFAGGPVLNNGGFYGTSFISQATATIGAYYFGSSGTKYLQYDATNFNLVGGGMIVAGTVTAAHTATNGTYYFGNSGTKYLFYDGSNYSLVGGNITTSNHIIQPSGTTLAAATAALNIAHLGGITQFGIAIRPVTETSTAVSIYNVAGTQVGTINQTSTTTFYNTSSDERLKEDLKSFDAGNIVDNTNVYDFKWKTTGERAYGVLGQQAVDVYPTAVTYLKEQDWYGVDYSKYVPVLLQELKALRERVRQLEAAVAGKPA